MDLAVNGLWGDLVDIVMPVEVRACNQIRPGGVWFAVTVRGSERFVLLSAHGCPEPGGDVFFCPAAQPLVILTYLSYLRDQFSNPHRWDLILHSKVGKIKGTSLAKLRM